MKICTITGCDKSVKARGFCSAHYERWRRLGDPLGSKPRPTLTERIERQVDRSASDGHWVWTGARSAAGYGVVSVEGRPRLVHRVLWMRAHGPIPEGTEIDHLCRVRECVNPDHLEPVTHKVNVLRGESPMAGYAKRTHCGKGHPYDEANTTYRKSGTRVCRTCVKIWRAR